MLTYFPAATLDELPDTRVIGVDVGGRRVALVRVGAEVFAFRPRCTHAGARLDRGVAINHTITCAMHGARFDVRTGRCVNSPYTPITTYPVRIEDGRVEVGLTDEPEDEGPLPFLAGG